MPHEMTLPPVGSTATEGIVVAWFKREGAEVRAGEPLLEVQFDKVSSEVVAPVDGRIQQILAPRDAVIRPGQTLAILLLPNESADAPIATTSRSAADGATIAASAPAGNYPASPAARRLAKELGIELAHVTPANGQRITEEDVQRAAQMNAPAAPPPAPMTSPPSEIRATPIAKRMAKEHGIDLATLVGAGPGGRISEQDVQAALDRRSAIATASTRAPLSPMRRAIARRMMESLHNTAQLTMTTQADVTALVAEQERSKATTGVTYTALIVRAVALALREHPYMNVRWSDDAIEQVAEINIGVAVALEAGLVAPVVKQADRLSLAALSNEIKRLSERARANQLTEAELTGGSFTLTNLGMYGIDAFTPILNPPEAAILGVGRISEQLVRQEHGITWRQFMTLSLTIDHRLIDGAPGAAFLQRVCQLLSQPASWPEG
ncbi:MAG TPA: dehydrogenase [Chloroflexi bacterium]|nr:dehydrogenase [Chloroflexota bacterium]HHW87131.1 2-oxo acid dehydrogenase subunit E2 [Chloroflexota bacterium]